MSAQSARVFEFPVRHKDGEVWEPWLTTADLARHFKVSPRTIRRWSTEGMPSRMIGGSRRFRLSQVEVWTTERSA